jgi:hypothetical protein
MGNTKQTPQDGRSTTRYQQNIEKRLQGLNAKLAISRNIENTAELIHSFERQIAALEKVGGREAEIRACRTAIAKLNNQV